MNTIKELEDLQNEMQNWRRDIHAHPEIAFEEHRTAKIVAEKLESFGLEVETGIAGTGVVGTLKKGTGNRSIGLRADLDALLINEANDFEHKSKNPGKMHVCGHDGHILMYYNSFHLFETAADLILYDVLKLSEYLISQRISTLVGW